MKIKIGEYEFQDHREEYNGLCLACGEIKYGDCEPDAEYYECDECGKASVCGMETALVMGHIEIVNESGEEAV